MNGEERRGAPEGKRARPRKDARSHLPFQGSTSAGDTAAEQSGASVPLDWMPDAVPLDKRPTAILPPSRASSDIETAEANTTAFGAPDDERPTIALPLRLPMRHVSAARPAPTDDMPDDERPTTVLPARGKSHGWWTWGESERRQMHANMGAVPPEYEDDDTSIEQQETMLLPAQGALFRDVTQSWFTGPLPIIDVDQHFTGPLPTTGPLPAIVVDRIATQGSAQHGHRPMPTPNARLQRVRLVPPEEEERLEALAHMSTMILPAIPSGATDDTSAEWSSVEDAASGVIETARTKAARSAKSHTFIINLAKSSGVYALSALAAPLVSLVLAPFLTHHLTPSEYGILAVLTTAVGLVAGITQLGLSSAFFRAYAYDFTSDTDRHGVVSTVSILLFMTALPVLAGIFIGAPAIAGEILGDISLAPLVRVAALACVAQNLTVPGYAWLRAESKALYFSILSIISLVVTLATNVVFVSVLGLGLRGAVAALGTGYASVVLFTVPIIILRAGVRFRRDIAVSLLTFGLPLVLSFASYWVLQLSDRFLLLRMSTAGETAQYAVAYSMGSALSALIISPFTLAWPTSMFKIAKRSDGARIFGLVFRGFGSVLYFAAFGLSLMATLFLQKLFPPEYRGAGTIIAIITASIVFYGVYFLFMIGANVLRKTWLTAVFTTVAAVLNVGLNLALIPRLGGMGAAASTLIAYIVLAGLAYLVNQRIYPIPFPVISWLAMGIVGVAFYVACWRLPLPDDQVLAWSCRFGICLVYGVLLTFYGGGGRLIRMVVRRSRSVAPAAGGAIA